MNETYVILDGTRPIDVVWNLCCTIGVINKLETLNPSVKLNYRKASLKEQQSVHVIQQRASRDYCFPD